MRFTLATKTFPEVPRWQPARVEVANAFTRNMLLVWAQREYNTLALRQKLRYNLEVWNRREEIAGRLNKLV